MTSSTTSRNRQLLAMSVFMLISKFIVLTFENETNFATQRRWSLCNDVKVFWFLYLGKWFVWQAVNRTPDGALPTRWQEALAEDMGVACAAVHDGKQHTSAHFCYWGTFSIMGVFHDTILVKKKIVEVTLFVKYLVYTVKEWLPIVYCTVKHNYNSTGVWSFFRRSMKNILKWQLVKDFGLLNKIICGLV